MTYHNLIQAMRLIQTAKADVTREEGMLITPHWRVLNHAAEYLHQQAERELRGE